MIIDARRVPTSQRCFINHLVRNPMQDPVCSHPDATCTIIDSCRKPPHCGRRTIASLMGWIALKGLVICLVLLSPAVVSAQDFLKDDDPTQPWRISADEIQHIQESAQFIARGDVTITKQNKTLNADYVRFDHKAARMVAEGQVKLVIDEDVLSGDRLEMDLEAELGTIHNGTIFVKSSNYLIQGNQIQKTGPYTYTIDDATFSTCAGEIPDWQITGKHLTVQLDGYGTAKHVTFRAKNVPLAYSPYFFFPAKQERQTGFIMPELSYSDRKGIEINQPFFWAINEWSDATFYAHYMGKRGLKAGAEYRYILDPLSKGTIMFDVLQDTKTDDGTGNDSRRWGYTDDDVIRPNKDRYWFRMKADQSLPLGVTAMLDIDIVSDQDYLKEFREGYTGFNKSDRFFHTFFGRDLEEYDDPIRLNRFNLNKLWTQFSLNAEIRWYDDVIKRRFDLEDTTLQRVPSVLFAALKQPVLNMPLYYSLDSEYVYFYREDGTRGQRLDLFPRVYYPLHWKSYFTFEPSVGVRQTAWYIDTYEDGASGRDDTFHRTLLDFRGDLSSQLHRVYDLNWSGIEKLKHTIRPQLLYRYIPEEDQSDLPFFDGVDKIDETHLIAWRLLNTITAKSPVLADPKETQKKSAWGSHRYAQLLRLSLSQSYDIVKEQDGDPEPFSPIVAKLQFAPLLYLALEADAEWSVYSNKFLSHNILARIRNRRGDKLAVEHRYTRDNLENIYLSSLLKIGWGLSLQAGYERNIKDDRSIETRLGFFYEAQCWSLNFLYKNEPEEVKYEVVLHLYGLGKMGG